MEATMEHIRNTGVDHVPALKHYLEQQQIPYTIDSVKHNKQEVLDIEIDAFSGITVDEDMAMLAIYDPKIIPRITLDRMEPYCLVRHCERNCTVLSVHPDVGEDLIDQYKLLVNFYHSII